MMTTIERQTREPSFVPQAFMITDRREESMDSVTLKVSPKLPSISLDQSPQPGQFNMLYQPGIGEIAVSISGISGESIMHTVRAVGLVSQSIARLSVGQGLMLRGPYGRSWPIDRLEAKNVLIIAGGLGLAPLRSLVECLMRHRERYREISVFYGCRSPDAILYQQELSDWALKAAIKLYLTVDHAGQGWNGHVGVVTKLLPKAFATPHTTIALICGPELMMRLVSEDLVGHGLNADEIFLSMERNMKCALGLCGHCQLGPHFVCRDGPIFSWAEVALMMSVREL